MEGLTRLRVLDVASNALTEVGGGLAALAHLSDLWLNDNRIQASDLLPTEPGSPGEGSLPLCKQTSGKCPCMLETWYGLGGDCPGVHAGLGRPGCRARRPRGRAELRVPGGQPGGRGCHRVPRRALAPAAQPGAAGCGRRRLRRGRARARRGGPSCDCPRARAARARGLSVTLEKRYRSLVRLLPDLEQLDSLMAGDGACNTSQYNIGALACAPCVCACAARAKAMPRGCCAMTCALCLVAGAMPAAQNK